MYLWWCKFHTSTKSAQLVSWLKLLNEPRRRSTYPESGYFLSCQGAIMNEGAKRTIMGGKKNYHGVVKEEEKKTE